MRRPLVFTLFVAGLLWNSHVRAENPPASQVLEKAIKAVGGEDKLAKAKAVSWKAKAKINFDGNENDMTLEATLGDLTHYHSEFEGDFGGNSFKGVTILSGDKGWRKFGPMLMEMDEDAVKNEKRTVYLAAPRFNLLYLKEKGFKVEPADGAEVQGKPTDALKVTGPDGKESTLYFDRESGHLVRMVARVISFMGDEYTQESNFSDYKEYDGIKVASRTTVKRDGDDFVKQELTEVKFMPSAPEATFAEPK